MSIVGDEAASVNMHTYANNDDGPSTLLGPSMRYWWNAPERLAGTCAGVIASTTCSRLLLRGWTVSFVGRACILVGEERQLRHRLALPRLPALLALLGFELFDARLRRRKVLGIVPPSSWIVRRTTCPT